MADCGAAGSTIDRAAAALIGNHVGNNNHTDSMTKSMTSFLGHAGMSNNNANVMPLAPPMALALPLNRTTPQTSIMPSTPKVDATRMNQAWNESSHAGMQQQHVSAASPMMMHQQRIQHHPQQQQQQQRQMQMMQHQQMQMQQQMQHQMMMQQQQQLHQLQLKQQAEQQQLAVEQDAAQQERLDQQQVKEEQQQELENAANLDTWHEGLEDDVATVGHEGLVQGATMEELAKAWAQAEAEYSQEYAEDATNATANLWTLPVEKQQHLQQHEQTDPYEFTEASREHPPEAETVDWMARGMRQFDEGYTREAITSFETQLRHVDGDHATAWLMLGRCHAENDEDSKAIGALENAVDRDPYSTQALLALGVSYVNELNHERALDCLKKYITHNPRFAGMELLARIENNNDDKVESTPPQDQVQRLLQLALDCCTTDANHDDDAADVQQALGVVYNVSRDYDKAIDCFRKALETHPENYQLHNKLGATLANSNQSNEALHAYHDALRLKPRYARAWLNMAISHANLSNYQDAARCYLQTLSLNPSATHCWSYLRIALSCCERWELIPLAAAQDLDGFREHYDFV